MPGVVHIEMIQNSTLIVAIAAASLLASPAFGDVASEGVVERAHPGWVQTVRTPDFQRWLEAQHPAVRQLAGSDDPQDAIKLLDWYKADRFSIKAPARPTSPADAPSTSADSTVTGTAFAIGDGYTYVTNNHVVANARALCLRGTNGNLYRARPLAVSAADDVVLLRSAMHTAPLQLAEAGEIERGMKVLTVGYPNPTVLGFESKVTEGIVNSLSGIRGDQTRIQVSVPIQPGNSGGPLLAENGDVVGVVVSKLGAKYMAATGDIPTSVSYAINVARLRALVETTPGVFPSMRPYKHTATLSTSKLVSKVEGSVVLIAASSTEQACSPTGDTEPPQLGGQANLEPKQTAIQIRREQAEAAAKRREQELSQAVEIERMRLATAQEKEAKKAATEWKASSERIERIERALAGEATNWREVGSSLGFVWWTSNYAPQYRMALRPATLGEQDIEALRQYRAFLMSKFVHMPDNRLPITPESLSRAHLLTQCGLVEQSLPGYFVVASSSQIVPQRFVAPVVTDEWEVFAVERRAGNKASALSSVNGAPPVGSKVFAESCV